MLRVNYFELFQLFSNGAELVNSAIQRIVKRRFEFVVAKLTVSEKTFSVSDVSNKGWDEGKITKCE